MLSGSRVVAQLAPAEDGVEDGVDDFFNDLLTYDSEMLETAIGGMEQMTSIERSGEAYTLVVAVCKDIIARREMAAKQLAQEDDDDDTDEDDAAPAAPGSVPSTPLREPADAASEENTSDAPAFSAGAATPGPVRHKGQAGRQRGRRKR